jgi:hypothetical protein
MSKKILIEAFYTQFNSFLKELSNQYPEDTDFNVFIETLNMAKFANPMLVVNSIKAEIVDSYMDKIINRDQSFFMNFDYKNKEIDLNIVDKLKGYISTMSEESKKIVWDYINLISKLVIKISEL